MPPCCAGFKIIGPSAEIVLEVSPAGSMRHLLYLPSSPPVPRGLLSLADVFRVKRARVMLVLPFQGLSHDPATNHITADTTLVFLFCICSHDSTSSSPSPPLPRGPASIRLVSNFPPGRSVNMFLLTSAIGELASIHYCFRMWGPRQHRRHTKSVG
ncbi:hypothetical protein EJ06DRAFT_422309 [Trichodelitschia bisporula]|uniref:Uncharacterized protein n=1 Tax=Trichodelitschia bisporula TaxID=703511 RepID=A0A6G1HWX1_9PEZI|nr:hypothetical protein EJ06DRAFT_422309 [Trichodelitschia bisporula]